MRAALGASTKALAALTFRWAAIIVASGAMIGLAAAYGLGRALEGWLFGVESTDTRAYLTALAAVVAVSTVACCIPAVRAARVDPVERLRAE